MSESVVANAGDRRQSCGMADDTPNELDELQARRVEKAKRETPPDLADELLALCSALRPIINRLEHDLATRRST